MSGNAAEQFGQEVHQATMMIKEDGTVLDVIGVEAENKATGERVVARAASDMTLKKGKYTLTSWNYKKMACPRCTKGFRKDCRLCLGKGEFLTFSYVMTPGDGKDVMDQKPWELTEQERADQSEANRIATERMLAKGKKRR